MSESPKKKSVPAGRRSRDTQCEATLTAGSQTEEEG